MSPFAIGTLAFLCVFSAALLGVIIRSRLPDGHMSADARDSIKLATAVIGTLAAIALGLLIASAKRSFDEASSDLRHTAGRVLLLDRVLAQYGSEAKALRTTLRQALEARLSDAGQSAIATNSLDAGLDIEPVQIGLRDLSPEGDGQRWLQGRALGLSSQIAEARWLRAETEVGGFPGAFLAFLILWLCLLFGSFGLLAHGNATVLATFFLCALSIAAALFLIIDMDHPYLGFITVSDAPLRAALARLGQS